MFYFFKNMDDFEKVNDLYSNFFIKPYPARETVQVSKLPKMQILKLVLLQANSIFNLNLRTHSIMGQLVDLQKLLKALLIGCTKERDFANK